MLVLVKWWNSHFSFSYRNLICVYSKKHMNDVPELTEMKRKANTRSLKEMALLLRYLSCFVCLCMVKVGLIIISCSSYFCSSWSMVLLQCQVVCRKCFPYLLLFLSFVSPDNEPWSLIPLYLCFLCSYIVLFLSLWTLEGIIHVQNKLNFLKYISWLWKVASNKLVRSYADFTC